MRCNAQEILHAMNASLQDTPVQGGAALSKVCGALSAALHANLLICTKDGGVTARSGAWFDGGGADKLIKLAAAKLHTLEGAKADSTLKALKILPDGAEDMAAYVVPLKAENARIGSVLLFKTKLDDADYICAEWLGTTAALLLRFGLEKASTDAERQRKAVRTALGALSYSELEAVTSIFAALPNMEGLVVASKVADQVGITRSVIVNALRKLESAVVIETRSLGMKGTYIRVTNTYLTEELEHLRA